MRQARKGRKLRARDETGNVRIDLVVAREPLAGRGNGPRGVRVRVGSVGIRIGGGSEKKSDHRSLERGNGVGCNEVRMTSRERAVKISRTIHARPQEKPLGLLRVAFQPV